MEEWSMLSCAAIANRLRHRNMDPKSAWLMAPDLAILQAA